MLRHPATTAFRATTAHMTRSATLGTVDNLDRVDQRDAFDASPASLSVSDAFGRLLFANDAFYRLYGFEHGEAVDVGMLSRNDDQEWTRSYLTRLTTGEIDEFETAKRFVRKDDSEFDGHVSMRAIRRDGHCVAIVAHVQPIDVRPRTDDNRVRKLLEHAAETLSLIDENGRLIETSGRYRTTLGYPPEFWEDRTILDVLVPEDAARIVALRAEMLESPGNTIVGDFHVQSADRRIECLEVSAVNMLHDPDLRGIVLSTRNVTAERQNTQAIQRLRDEAVAEADRRSNLLATVSHELRNPLHAMSGLAELLSSDASLGDEARDLATSLQRQLLQMTSVTDDLLDTARFEVGQFELRSSAIEVRIVLDDVLRTARAAANGRITVELDVDESVPRVITTDPARLQQIISNLVGNAVKFTDHGSVTVAVTTTDDRQMRVSVVDTGSGIPPEDAQRIFLPFATSSTSGDRRGAGLGLAIVKRLVEVLDGTIEARSEVGVGSTFVINLPLRAGVLAADVAPSEPGPIATQRPRILVVEDTVINQQLAIHQLERLGMDAAIAESAEVALELVEHRSFDAILMDFQLPGMNGRDATRELRARGVMTPVIGITASSTAADERACLDAGMDFFLPKPVGLDTLRTTLEAAIRITSARDDAPERMSTATATFPVRDLNNLVDELGDRELVAGLVTTFLGELDARQVAIREADDATAGRHAHTLKSSAALLGAHDLAAACAAVERDPATRTELTPLIEAVRVGLHAWLDQVPATEGDMS